MNLWEMIVLVVAIGTVASIFQARVVRPIGRGHDDHADEVRALKERIAVLERIATENNRGLELDREIERLRDRH